MPSVEEGDQFVITAEEVEAEDGPDGRVVHLNRNVTITRGGATLVGARGVYYEATRHAVITGGVEGVDRGRTIACDTLEYFRDTDVAWLIGNASYSDSSGTTSARRIELLRPQNVAVCRGDVVSSDAEGTSSLTAGWLVYDFDREEARASVGPVLTTFTEDGEEDARLTAETIELDPRDSSIAAFGSVLIERDDIAARARVALLEADRSIALYGGPTVSQGGDNLSGETVLVATEEEEIRRVTATGNARADYHIEEGPRQAASHGSVGGDTLTMFMEDGEATLTTVRGRATSEHFVGESGERNTVSSEAIDVMFDGGRIRRVVFRRGASGTYFFLPEETEEPAEASPGDEGGAVTADAGAAGSEGAGAAAEGADAAPEEPAVELESVTYGADDINYYVERNRITLSGNASVEYRTTVLYAGEVIFDPEAQVLEASGEPDLREQSDRLVGERLSYDLEEKTGVVEGGVTTFEDGLYYGSRIVREGDGTLRVGRGVYTTCSNPEPHFRLVSHRMKVYLDDKVVAKPLILYIGKIPAMALPFYVFPIRKDRHSGFLLPQIELGFSEGGGRFIKNFGYYWAPNDYWDVSAWADYYEQTKWIGNLEARYKRRYLLSGSVSTSFMEELLYNKRRWDLKFTHRQELGRVWSAGASGDFRSDATYASDSNQSIEESVNRSLHSQIWIRGRWSTHSMGVTLDRREQLDQDVVSELLPKVDVSASQKPLVSSGVELPGYAAWLKKVSYNWSATVVNDRDEEAGERESHQGLGVTGAVRSSNKILGWLNVSPKASFRQNWYDRDKSGETYPGRFTYDAGVSVGTTVYGTFFPRAAGIEAVRHIIEPSASFSWSPEFDRYFDEDGLDRFYSFSGFGSTPRSRKTVSMSLVNKLQLKVGSGEEVRKLDNLLRLSTSTSYNFKNEDRPWSDLVSGLEVRPDPSVSLRWSARHDAYGGAIQSSSVTATLNLTGARLGEAAEPWEDRIIRTGSPADELRRQLASRNAGDLPGRRPWDASMTFRYSRGADSDNATYWIDGGLAFSPTNHWRLNYSVHYDLRNQEVASQEYSVYRDLHCWEAQFTRRYYEEEWQYYFRISVKALPEIQAESGSQNLERSVR